MNMGEKLELAIINAGLSVNAVAQKADISAQTLYSIIKRNNKKIDIDILLKVLDVLGISFDYLIADEISEEAFPLPSDTSDQNEMVAPERIESDLYELFERKGIQAGKISKAKLDLIEKLISAVIESDI